MRGALIFVQDYMVFLLKLLYLSIFDIFETLLWGRMYYFLLCEVDCIVEEKWITGFSLYRNLYLSFLIEFD